MPAAIKPPRHVGLIMDGNGRWAKKRLLPRSLGHAEGMKALIALSRHAKELGIEYLTVYALSTENMASRPREELEGLFGLLRQYFGKNLKELHASGARVKIIGDISAFPADIAELLADGEKNSPEGAAFTLCFALNYGGRDEIVRAAQKLASEGGAVTEERFSAALYTAGMPAPDLIIRTGGELRLSNFLLWQAAYAELYFTDVLFPDFGEREFDKAIAEYNKRNRRFGGV